MIVQSFCAEDTYEIGKKIGQEAQPGQVICLYGDLGVGKTCLLYTSIRLATQIGSGLVGVAYILDEPSIGLHQRDNDKLIRTLKNLRDLGNTLIVVEHDEDTMLAADYIVDIGPKAGEYGGEVVATGTAKQIMKNKRSITGAYLSGKIKIPVPQVRRKPSGFLKVVGAQENNLKNIDVEIPLGIFTCVTGVSGSGKSSLVNQILYKRLAKELNRAKTKRCV